MEPKRGCTQPSRLEECLVGITAVSPLTIDARQKRSHHCGAGGQVKTLCGMSLRCRFNISCRHVNRNAWRFGVGPQATMIVGSLNPPCQMPAWATFC